LWYYVIKAPNPILLSCVTNSASFLIGLLIHACI
jgi:hypothetical protein